MREASLNAASIPEKRVKSGEMRLQVNNVVEATVRMEQLVKRAGGIVEQSEIRQAAGRQDDTRYSSDSLRRVTWYAPEATLRLRVPVVTMDSVVQAITGMAAFVEFRSLSDNDMSLQHLHNKLLNGLTREPGRAIAHTRPNKELDVRQYEDEAKRGTINRTIENLGIDQLASFSTLIVQLRQPDLAMISIVPDPERFAKSYFLADASQALGNGLFELRHVGKLNTRVLWFFMKGRRIVLLHGDSQQGDKRSRPRDLATAQERATGEEERKR